jgi:hypothetical protein
MKEQNTVEATKFFREIEPPREGEEGYFCWQVVSFPKVGYTNSVT